MFASGIWAYPTPFPEIYCITAVKTQASGCIPVTSDFAALEEMVQFGDKIHCEDDRGIGVIDGAFLDKYTERLIWWLQHPEEQDKIRAEMMEWAKTNSWDNVCNDWVENFNEDFVRT